MIFVGKFWSDAVPASADSAGAVQNAIQDSLNQAGASATAQEMTAALPPLGSSAVAMPGWGSMLMQFGLALLVVVLLILVLQRVAKRFGSSWKRGQNADDIQVLSERSMGQKLSLAIVEVMDQRWLVSVSPQGIQRVADIDYEPDPQPALIERKATKAAPKSLRKKNEGVGGLNKKEFAQFEQQLKDRLQTTGEQYPNLRDIEAQS